MKKGLLSMVCFLFVLALLLGSFGSANAAAGDDPTVTPVSGDLEFTTEIVPIASLPGTHELANQMLAPIGFPDGEAQFGGNGIRVSGFSAGKAKVCFSLDTVAVQQGWGGKVGVWNGSKWVKLETSITTGTDEAAATLACATITGNGTYAFIKYVTEPAKLPTPGACSFEVMAIPVTAGETSGPTAIKPLVFAFDMQMDAALILTSNGYTVPVGGSISYKIISSVPEGFILSGASGSGIVDASGPGIMIAVFSPPVLIDWNNALEEDFEYVTVRIFFPDCYADFNFSPEIVF